MHQSKDATMIAYHVTSADDAQNILSNGFEGGWGDVGFGVYVFGNLHDAVGYMDAGGWDGLLDPENAAIISVEVEDASEFERVVPDRDWPNPEDYENVFWHPMEDNVLSQWKPKMEIVGLPAKPTI